MDKAKTVAAISFLANHSISMDVEEVLNLEMTPPMQLDDGSWFCEMLVRTENGTLAMQMLADSPERFQVRMPD